MAIERVEGGRGEKRKRGQEPKQEDRLSSLTCTFTGRQTFHPFLSPQKKEAFRRKASQIAV